MAELSCFKAYDIRGQVGANLDEGIAYRIGRAFARVMEPGRAVLGRDTRDSSPALQAALASGLADEGVDVLDIGLCGTEEVYFATDHLQAGGGLMVTASHNPIGDNGMKPIGRNARPISRASGLQAIHDMAAADAMGPARGPRGTITQVDPRPPYVARVLSFIDPAALAPLTVLVNAGNGAAGPTFDAIAEALDAHGAPLRFVRHHHAPDPSFPNGIPNPLLPENQPKTGAPVRAHKADMGVAWDGDFDRCFLFDADGAFIDGEYIVGLLAAAMLAQVPGAKVVHDPRILWNTQRIVAGMGGEAVVSQTGHALIKEKMRAVDGAYGGEMSAHHYFRDFMYCDSGMIPWLLVLAHMSKNGQSLADLVAEMRARHPSSGEINFRLSDPEAAVAAVETQFSEGGSVDRLDGLSVAFADWRFNLRKSNTEPVVRLNVETRGDPALLRAKTDAITDTLTAFA
ncbi:MAG: phosphomannomutase [Pseudomonadota bacterium]